MDHRPIGIFDSGLGGLTVVKAIEESLPGESFIYVGDTARMPYGEKSIDEIRTFGRQIISFLEKEDVKVIIVACGTISSNVIEDLRGEFSLPLIDVVRPGIDAAISAAKKRIGVIATAATIKGGFFQRELKKSHLEVEAIACPLFVPLIEEGLSSSAIVEIIASSYLHQWKENPVDTLILGCTHYPLLSDAIGKVLKDTKLINMAESTVRSANKYMSENGLLNTSNVSKKYYVSGDTEKFDKLSSQITGSLIESQKVYWE